MNLEIFSFSDALKYEPRDKSYALRIISGFTHVLVDDLKESKNWVGINKYYFDDKWPKDWKEYSWYDTNCKEFVKYLENEQKEHPKMTEESLMGYFESRGWPEGRDTLFDENFAKKILNDFEKIREGVDTVVIHCLDGKNRAPSVGIAMNEIYGWGIVGLKEKFPEYRRYIYETMIGVSKKQ